MLGGRSELDSSLVCKGLFESLIREEEAVSESGGVHFQASVPSSGWEQGEEGITIVRQVFHSFGSFSNAAWFGISSIQGHKK